ncbi:phosphate/phosphite/phosphonate ABC transporter substrate-binding protein [Halovenus sp. WSH3]|uniref:Phosphate/phosphite/phosphonate ABC transporter substrate-binding protein n=1 Tax=Halovenus carboxidivorans TaxID=2692199 RepID=A0A6B0T5D0_9EURY|nr:phosphate/phosphite/phosphonate ABC transporter substrate-binding protein [Halovenus carboxidivorans]MXR50763.1 phosphate/phosphite/phosphonate ABC transporter substrate-binding protein [Halovenus carboxidivorans]
MSEQNLQSSQSRRKFLVTAGAVGATFAAGCTGGGSDQAFGDGTVDFNVSPSVAQENLEAQYTPVQEYLSNELDADAEMQLANNYSAVIQALGSGTSDVAETGPFAAALGAESDRAEIVLQRQGYGSWTYMSGIAVRRDSDIDELSDLEGETIAFADPLSTSGALFPLYGLSNDGGLDIGNLPTGDGSGADFTPNFAGSHPASYETMANGQAAAAGIGGFVQGLKEGADTNPWGETAEWLWTREGLPRAPIVVSPELSEENKNAVVDAFLNAPDDIYWGVDGEEGTDDDLWFNAVREAGVEKYQPVIDAANELGVGTDIFQQN